jgi:hypothetical protein
MPPSESVRLCERARELDRLYLAWDRALSAMLADPSHSRASDAARARAAYDAPVNSPIKDSYLTNMSEVSNTAPSASDYLRAAAEWEAAVSALSAGEASEAADALEDRLAFLWARLPPSERLLVLSSRR